MVSPPHVKAALNLVLSVVDRIGKDKTVSGADYRDLVEQVEDAMRSRREGLDADERNEAGGGG